MCVLCLLPQGAHLQKRSGCLDSTTASNLVEAWLLHAQQCNNSHAKHAASKIERPSPSGRKVDDLQVMR